MDYQRDRSNWTADNFREFAAEGWEDSGKAIPYIGAYWRPLDQGFTIRDCEGQPAIDVHGFPEYEFLGPDHRSDTEQHIRQLLEEMGRVKAHLYDVLDTFRRA